MSKPKSKVEKIEFDTSNENLIQILRKHMDDWFQDHPTEKFISPQHFQNMYTQFDKYTTASFRTIFYKIKSKIKDGENDFCF